MKIDKPTFLHPFSNSIVSLSSYTYRLFSLYFQNNYEIYSVKNEYSSNTKMSSRKELLFVFYKEFTKKDECNYWHAFNKGQKKFQNYYPDLYCETHKKVFSFRGCAFHYCEKCMRKKNRTDESLHFTKVPMSEFKKRDLDEELFYLTKCGDDVTEFEAVYECDFNEVMKSEEFLIFQAVDAMWDRPTIRLTPRATVRSGLTEQFHLKWKQSLFPNENFFISDVNSLYTCAAIKYPFPVGKCITVIGSKLQENVRIVEKEIYFGEKKLFCGAAHVRVLPPRNLKHPFLQYRVNDLHCFLTLCKKCAETKTKKCTHEINLRVLESCWLISDLNLALKLGYKITAWFELHYYEKTDFVLRDYSKILYALKLRNSGFPSNLKSDAEKMLYCQEINNAMQFCDNFSLKLNNVVDNPAQKQFFKSMLNNLYGKFSQNSNFTRTTFVNSHYQLMEIFKSNEVVGISNINSFRAQVEYRPIDIPQNNQSCIYTGAQITSYSRCIVYSYMEELLKSGAKIYSVINDAIFYSLPKNVKDPLPFSNICGHFKSLVDPSKEIVSYFALGNCNYSFLTKNDSGTLEQTVKVKGLTLSNFSNQNIITTETFENFIDQHFENNIKKIIIQQKRYKVCKDTKQFQLKFQNFTFDNDPHIKRFISSFKDRVETLPYGYLQRFSKKRKMTQLNLVDCKKAKLL